MKSISKFIVCVVCFIIFQLIQRRIDGSEDFYRGWNEYKNGFGRVEKNGEFWLGKPSIVFAIYQLQFQTVLVWGLVIGDRFFDDRN